MCIYIYIYNEMKIREAHFSSENRGKVTPKTDKDSTPKAPPVVKSKESYCSKICHRMLVTCWQAGFANFFTTPTDQRKFRGRNFRVTDF